MSEYTNLLKPIKVGKTVYKNRMVASPIYCGTFALDDNLFYVLANGMITRAMGGSAQITFGETSVDSVYANREPMPPLVYDKPEGVFFEKLKGLVSLCKQGDTKVLIELCHCGNSRLPVPGSNTAYGPMSMVNEEGVSVIGMNEDQMKEVTENFVKCAVFMKNCGFDGVLIHAGHGWLLHQFLSERTNQREDEYGGSLQARAKFPIEIIKNVREAVGDDFIIELRVSGEEKEPDGMGIDEVTAFVKMAEPYIDLVHVSVGTYRNPILSGEFSSMYAPHGLNAEMAKQIKENVSVPVVLVGGINDPDQAEKLIAEEYCDIVAFGRQLTADPQFPNKVAAGKTEDIAKCLRCFKCFPGPLEEQMDENGHVIPEKMPGCTVNPLAFFMDQALLKTKPEGSRNVLIAGGGIAGIEAALVAHSRGHKVTLCEKTDRLGGLLHFTDSDKYKTDLHDFMQLMIRRVEASGINIMYNTEVNQDVIDEYNPDIVISAIGSEPLMPPIPGLEDVMPAVESYECQEKIGDSVIILGAGLVGCETAVHLAKIGKKVTLIEKMDEAAKDAYPMHRIALMNELKVQNVECLCGCTVVKVEQGSVMVNDCSGQIKEYKAVTILSALGMKSKADLSIKEDSCKVIRIGDYAKVGTVYSAMMSGFVSAMSIK